MTLINCIKTEQIKIGNKNRFIKKSSTMKIIVLVRTRPKCCLELLVV